MREVEIHKNLMVREDGMVKNTSVRTGRGSNRIYKDWRTGSNTNGYRQINIPGEKKKSYVHRLVALAFIPNPENKEEVNHKNGRKNDNRVCNLEWNTYSENLQHAYDTGLKVSKKGKEHQSSKHYTEAQYKDIKKHLSEKKLTQKEIGALYGVSANPINSIKRGTHWTCELYD